MDKGTIENKLIIIIVFEIALFYLIKNIKSVKKSGHCLFMI